MNTTSCWSASLQEQTHQAIVNLQVSTDGRLHFKHKTLGYAYAELGDLMNFPLILNGKVNKLNWKYEGINELLLAGWAID